MSDAPRPRPRAFAIGPAPASAEASYASARDFVVEEQPDAFAVELAEALPEDEAAVEAAQRAGVLKRSLWSWSGLFWSSACALASIAIGVWIDDALQSLFARFLALGWIAVALLAVAVASLIALASREFAGVLRQKKIAELHEGLAAAYARDDRDQARKAALELIALYAQKAETAAARAHISGLTREIVDAHDLLEIAERSIVMPLDAQAQGEIARAAKRVSMVTTLSPRALLDVIFVAAQAIRLVRRIAEIYGGRPGVLGLWRIARSVVSHLAITGGMAVGDSIVQQVVGHGVAARLSARLGEGVLNGLLTTRVGISAMAVCRPSPFFCDKAPGVSDVAPFLFSKGDATALNKKQ